MTVFSGKVLKIQFCKRMLARNNLQTRILKSLSKFRHIVIMVAMATCLENSMLIWCDLRHDVLFRHMTKQAQNMTKRPPI